VSFTETIYQPLGKNSIRLLSWDALGQAAAWYARKGFALPQSLANIFYGENDLLPIQDAAVLWRLRQFTADDSLF
jgi:hypothetical protein